MGCPSPPLPQAGMGYPAKTVQVDDQNNPCLVCLQRIRAAAANVRACVRARGFFFFLNCSMCRSVKIPCPLGFFWGTEKCQDVLKNSILFVEHLPLTVCFPPPFSSYILFSFIPSPYVLCRKNTGGGQPCFAAAGWVGGLNKELEKQTLTFQWFYSTPPVRR